MSPRVCWLLVKRQAASGGAGGGSQQLKEEAVSDGPPPSSPPPLRLCLHIIILRLTDMVLKVTKQRRTGK